MDAQFGNNRILVRKPGAECCTAFRIGNDGCFPLPVRNFAEEIGPVEQFDMICIFDSRPDLFLVLLLPGVVEAGDPEKLVDEDTGQRQDDQNDYIFERRFHVNKCRESLSDPAYLVRLNNICTGGCYIVLRKKGDVWNYRFRV